jgi:hypothetical protein
MSDNPLVIPMNKSTSENWDDIPLPAKQQLGYNHPSAKDARSGNGVSDTLHSPPERGGHEVQPVTYHLESTPAPSEPAGAPGSDSYNSNVRGMPGAVNTTAHLTTEGGVTVARHEGSGPITTQREQPGRDARLLAANASSADGGDGPPNASIAEVLEWVGDDSARARTALEAENARPTPRTTLVAQLNDKV